MNKSALKQLWKSEEAKVFEGWNFSCLDGRIVEEDLLWDYKKIVLKHLNPDRALLDMGTGGGEFLLTLGHPYQRTYVTEAYPPNVELCRRKLGSLGIHVSEVAEDDILPYEDESMDMVINRHESYDIHEVYRILKPGGIFITQQVGGKNNVVFSNWLCNAEARENDDKNMLEHQMDDFTKAGFSILDSGECYTELRFLDTGALVYFAKIIEWEFIDFSVERCFDNLMEVEQEIRDKGHISSQEHRYFIEARK